MAKIPSNVQLIKQANPGGRDYYFVRSLDAGPKGTYAGSYNKDFTLTWLRENGFTQFGVEAEETYTRDAAKAQADPLRTQRDS